ncbi:hypothetical protein [Streptomyces griseus]|uniref:hypothetical protein n=1 Tax=Streptomyces griseus TaxID=1911 RepID=UPI003F4D448F
MSDSRPWIYGADHDDPDPRTPTPGHVYVELVGDRSTGSSSTPPATPPRNAPTVRC